MKPQLHLLFPTPLFQSSIPVQEEWLRCVEDLQYERTSMDNGFISFDRNIWQHEVLRGLYHEIRYAAQHFAYGQLAVAQNVYLDLCRGWGVKHGPGDWAQNHCHMNSVFSGIYYLDVQEETGDVVFEKGQHFPNCFMPTLEPDVTHFNQITMKSWRIRPETGTLLIFPSQLIHNVEKNLTADFRYCIGFDIFIRGSIGEDGGSAVTIQ